MADNLTIRMKLHRETKGTFVYNAVKDDAAVTTVYVKKDAYPDGVPKKIVVAIKDKDDG